MLEVIAKRKKTWIGHVVRGDGLLKLVIEGSRMLRSKFIILKYTTCD